MNKNIQQKLSQALILTQQKQYQSAQVLYQEILADSPNHLDALYHLAKILAITGPIDKSISLIQKAITLIPQEPYFHFTLAEFYCQEQKFDQAFESYNKALTLDKDFFQARYKLATLVTHLHNYELAYEHYQYLLKQNINPHMIHNDLGNLYAHQSNQSHQAITHYKKALEYKANYVEAHNNLGTIYSAHQEAELAIKHFKTALEIQENFYHAHFNLANLYKDRMNYSQARQHYHRNLQLNPEDYEAYLNSGSLEYIQGNLLEAINYYQQALKIKQDYINAQLSLWLAMLCLPDIEITELYQQITSWGKQYTYPTISIQKKSSPLRIGYLSSDFRQHSAQHVTKALLTNPDKKKWTTICLSNVKMPDAYTFEYQQMADQWHDINQLQQKEVIDIIKNDIDILVDPGMGFTMGPNMEIFLTHSAPLQVSLYPVTMGAGFDYLISDHLISKKEEELHYREKVLYLSDSIFRFIPPSKSPEIKPPPYLKRGYITFGSFNNLAKLNPVLIEVWAQILKQVPDSKLVLKAPGFQDHSTRNHYQDLFGSFGINNSRIKFLDYAPNHFEHLKDFQSIDIMLDSWPFCGHITSLEALWMGVPVVTCKSDRTIGRVSASFLTILGMDELISDHLEDYLQRTLTLVNQPTNIVKTHQQLRPQLLESCLCDLEGYSQQIYELFDQIWSNHD